MTNKEFFLKCLAFETPITVRVLKALPTDKLDWTPHEKSKTAKEMAMLFPSEAWMMAEIAKGNNPDLTTMGEMPKFESMESVISSFEKMMEGVMTAVKEMPEDKWDNDDAVIKFPVGEWADKRHMIMWGLLNDWIHHRGQVSVYIRPMGGKVPSIYGPSGDSPSAM